jgi:septal ring factor EnvC (AmiA/AmiB activator)
MFTMDDLQNKTTELEESQVVVKKLEKTLASQDSALKSLRASSKTQSEELDVLKHKVRVLESDHKVLKAAYDKAMDKVVRVARLLVKKPDVTVPEDIAMAIFVCVRT